MDQMQVQVSARTRTTGSIPFGETYQTVSDSPAFQSAINLRSICLRVSGAVAPSAPTTSRSLPQHSFGINSAELRPAFQS